jgi:hypothetical protein
MDAREQDLLAYYERQALKLLELANECTDLKVSTCSDEDIAVVERVAELWQAVIGAW